MADGGAPLSGGRIADAAGVLLAGGGSRRLGRDKARVIIGGITMAERAARVLREVFAETLAVAGRPGGLAGLEVGPVVHDAVPGLGPLAGIAAALAAIRAPAAFVCACDLPFLDAAFIRRQVEAWRAAGRPPAFVPALGAGRLEPLHALYGRECGPVFAAALERGVRRVREALAGIAWVSWPVAPPAEKYFTNINTPADLAALAAAGGPAPC